MASRITRERAAFPLNKLERKVMLLARKLDRLTPMVAFISSFAPEPFKVLEPIPVTIRPVDRGFVASFLDANINASGETRHGAFVNVKDLMIAIFERLGKEPKHRLGKGPARQLAVLKSVMRRKDRHASHHERPREKNRQKA